MGIFFNRKKKNKNQGVGGVNNINATLIDDEIEQDMVDIVKKEQQNDIINPFVEEDKNISVAKRYGTKYQDSLNKGQIASSIVVDVRSYVKPTETSEKGKSKFDLDLESLNIEDDEKPVQKPKMSFFDELMKSIDDDINELNLNDSEEEEKHEEPLKKIEPIKQVKPKTKPKKRKSVDIDIISGDFGGVDIL